MDGDGRRGYGGRVHAPTLRPLAVGEILDVGFKIYTRHFGLLIKTVALVVVPVQILGALILLGSVDDPAVLTGNFGLDDDPTTDTDTTGALASVLVSVFGGGLAQIVATAACVKAVADAYLQQRPEAGGSLRFAGRRLHSLVWVSILQILLLIVAYVALIVPGVWLTVAWILVFPVLLLEGCKGRSALGRSFRLVRRRWWPTFAVILVAYLLAAVLQFFSGILIGLATFVAEDSVIGTVALTTVGNSIAYLLATPFTAAIVVLVYFDLRVRKEGLDIALLAERIGVSAPAEGPLGHNRPPRPAFVAPPQQGEPSAPPPGPTGETGPTEPGRPERPG